MACRSSTATRSISRALCRASQGQQRPLANGLMLSMRSPLRFAAPTKLQSSLRASHQQLRFKSESTTSTTPEPVESASKIYSFSEITDLTSSPSPNRILIDVREPSELQGTGHIPGAKNMPISSAPEGLYLPAEDFEEKFGWSKPKNTDELVFYCKAGVRSRAAAGIAKMAGWSKIGEYPGSWMDWVEKGGKIERS